MKGPAKKLRNRKPLDHAWSGGGSVEPVVEHRQQPPRPQEHPDRAGQAKRPRNSGLLHAPILLIGASQPMRLSTPMSAFSTALSTPSQSAIVPHGSPAACRRRVPSTANTPG